MSLWEAEVEKSKFSPVSSTRRKVGVLERFLSSGNHSKSSKSKVKYVAPHSNIEQYEFPDRGQPVVDRKPPGQHNYSTYPAGLSSFDKNPVKHSQVPHEARRVVQKMSDPPKARRRPAANTAPSLRPAVRSETPTARANVDLIAKLILQKSELEQEMKDREARYHYLLTESQSLTKAMREERDLACKETETLRNLPKPSVLKETLQSKSRYAMEELEHMFQPHDEFYFKHAFAQLEKVIRNYVLNVMKDQPDMMKTVDLNPSMDFYILKHDLRQLTVFGVRDLRCIVCRGFLMEFLLERVFRVFLFGMAQSQVFKEGFQALSAIDIGRGARWASAVAKVLIASSADYNPEKAALELIAELKIYLGALIDMENSSGLEQVVDKAIELARDCRLDVSSFSLDMPGYGMPFDPKRMDSSKQEQGDVAITYAPAVTRRGNRRGQQYQMSFVVAKAKVWRDSIFMEFKNLREDPNTMEDEGFYEESG